MVHYHLGSDGGGIGPWAYHRGGAFVEESEIADAAGVGRSAHELQRRFSNRLNGARRERKLVDLAGEVSVEAGAIRRIVSPKHSIRRGGARRRAC